MIIGQPEDSWMRLNPSHPGFLLRGGFLDAWDDYPGMTVAEAAGKLGMSRGHLSRIVNERAPVTMEVAMKLEAIGWDTADSWLQFQLKYDLAQERKRLNRPLAKAPATLTAKALLAESQRKRRKRRPPRKQAKPGAVASGQAARGGSA